MTSQAPPGGSLGIADIAETTGLSKDTLRWYEKEGLLPSVERDPSGRRAYTDADLRLVLLVVRLKRTGMPIREIRDFVSLAALGASTHGRRLRLLDEHRHRVLNHLEQVRQDLTALDDKIEHYQRLIADGLDCGDKTISDSSILEEQRRTR